MRAGGRTGRACEGCRGTLRRLVTAFLLMGILQCLGTDPVRAGGAYLPAWSVQLSDQVTCLDMSADGNVIVAGHGKKISLLNSTGEALWSHDTTSAVVDVDLSADGQFAYATDANNSYLLGKDQGLINTSEGASGFSVAVNSSLFLALTHRNWLGWNDEFLFLPPDEASRSWKSGSLGANGTSVIAVSEVGNVFVTGTSGLYKELGSLRRLGLQCYDFAGTLQWEYKDIDATTSSSGTVYSVDISGDAGTVVASNTGDTSIYVLSRDGSLVSKTLLGEVGRVAVSPDGTYVGAVLSTGVSVLTREGRLVWDYQGDSKATGIALSRNADLVLVGFENGSLTLFAFGRTIADSSIRDAQAAIALQESRHFVLTQAQNLLIQAQSAFERDDYGEAQSLALQAQRNAEETGMAANAAQSAVGDAQKSIAKEKSRGVLLAMASDLLVQAQSAFAQGEYAQALDLAVRAGQSAETMGASAVAAQTSLRDAKKAVVLQTSAGITVGDASVLMDQAQDAFDRGEYDRSKSLADQARLDAEDDGVAAARAWDAIQGAAQAIEQEASRAFVSDTAAATLQEARNAYDRGRYAAAEELATGAAGAAQDIDGDGVPNEEDFAPSLNNRMIYIAGPLALLALFAAVSSAVARAKRRRLLADRHGVCPARNRGEHPTAGTPGR
jgi:hypothetical protein